MTIRQVNPEDPEVAELVAAHMAFASATTEPEHIHAMDQAKLAADGVRLYALRRSGRVVAIGGLKALEGESDFEIKSMHTAADARGTGAGRDMLHHLIAEAHRLGARRVRLETGSGEAFAPARRLYRAAGFETTGAFGDYEESAVRVLMSLDIPRA